MVVLWPIQAFKGVKDMDVVTIGESMVLFTPDSISSLTFASKFDKTIGGAESNVAIALARLGHQVGWISNLGHDDFGIYIRNMIRGEGVDTSQVKFLEDYPTAVFFKERKMVGEPKVFYYRKNSAASQMTPKDIDESFIAKAKYLHITGITPALSPTCLDTVMHSIKLAKKHGLTIIFDPNIRLKLWSKEEATPVLRDIANKCDIVLPGIDEGELLTGKIEPEAIAREFLQHDTSVVIVKLGKKGAYYATVEESGYVEGIQLEQVVDPIGAGDGFAAGFISGLISGIPISEAVHRANTVASYALTVPGDAEGYPYSHQIDPNYKEVQR